MKQISIIIFFLTILFSPAVMAHKSDTGTENIKIEQTVNIETDNDDLSLGQFLSIILFIVVWLIAIAVGIALTILALFIIFALVTFGIISTSVIVGLNNRSFASGFKTLIVLCSIVAGMVVCSGAFWLLNRIVHWWSLQESLLIGAASGLISGFFFGLIAFYLIQKLTTFFKVKLNLVN